MTGCGLIWVSHTPMPELFEKLLSLTANLVAPELPFTISDSVMSHHSNGGVIAASSGGGGHVLAGQRWQPHQLRRQQPRRQRRRRRADQHRTAAIARSQSTNTCPPSPRPLPKWGEGVRPARRSRRCHVSPTSPIRPTPPPLTCSPSSSLQPRQPAWRGSGSSSTVHPTLTRRLA